MEDDNGTGAVRRDNRGLMRTVETRPTMAHAFG